MSIRRTAALVLALAGTGCLEDVTQCADGTLCPAGNVCHGGTCQGADLVAACAGVAAGAACELDGVGAGTCRDGVCLVPVCGNDRLDEGEVCDDGNLASGDGCRGDCQSVEACGNGTLDPGEGCDDGAANADTPDALCRTDCARARCGDGVVDPSAGEACDAGAANSAAPDGGCRLNCQPRRCADGVVDVQAGEVCDDGNLAPGDGCSFDCVSDEVCGNGVIDVAVGELCDDGGLIDHDGCADTCVTATPGWQHEAGGLSARSSAALAFDAARGEAVLFGGSVGFGPARDTWVRRGRDWARRWPRHAPTARTNPAMAYDPIRAVIVLFGGANASGQPLDDTWTWDGTDWTAHAVARPAARSAAALACEPATGVMLLAGGAGEGGTTGDAWAWDGTTWTEHPYPDDGDIMYLASDARHGGLVAVGERAMTSLSWRWDGEAWTSIAGPQPPVRFDGDLVATPSRGSTLLLGGGELHLIGDPPTDPAAVWELTDAGWQQASFAAALPEHRDATATYDSWRARPILTTGAAVGGNVATTWELVGDSWQLVDDGTRPAPPEDLGPAVYDVRRGEVLAYDTRDLWRWAGGVWQPLVHPSHPSIRNDVGLAYDAARGEVILFGGYGASGRLGETWRWDGTAWTQLAVAGPSPRSAVAMTYDPTRGEVILFGGYDPAFGRRDDTWRWDGTAWTQLATAHAPTGRDRASLAADVRAGTLVLIGGTNPATGASYDDTWVWDGSDWTDVTPALQPTTRSGAAMATDPWRGGVLLFGDDDASDQQLWWWDGAAWTASEPDVAPPARGRASMVADPAARRWLRVGGHGGFGVGYLHDTWTLGAPGGHAEEACRDDAAVDLDGDGLRGCADPECWWACAPSCGPAALAAGTCALATAVPACGDGVCDPIEGCRSCAADCGTCAPACGDAFCDAGEDAATCPGDCGAP